LDPLVDLDPLATDLAPILAPFVSPFVAALDRLEAALDLFGLVVEVDPFVLTCCFACAARKAKSSCLLEHPVFSKIRLMVGDVSSSSMVAREEALVNVREGRMS